MNEPKLTKLEWQQQEVDIDCAYHNHSPANILSVGDEPVVAYCHCGKVKWIPQYVHESASE